MFLHDLRMAHNPLKLARFNRLQDVLNHWFPDRFASTVLPSLENTV